MSLNWKEIQLILSEFDVTGSKIQSVIQNSFHAVTWEMYSAKAGRFCYYTEVGTDQSRLNLISDPSVITKTKKLQRFVQFARKNIEGSVITRVSQLPFDRCVIWDLDNHGRKLKIYIRLYSGSGANIIVTDEENTILDLLLRRPGRDETSGQKLVLETRTGETKQFDVREYEGSFNEFIEKTCSQQQTNEIYENLLKQLNTRKENQLGKIRSSITSAERTIEANKNFEYTKFIGDVLAANIHKIHKGDGEVEVTDWNKGTNIVIFLDKSLTPSANVQAYYEKYQKEAGAFNNAKTELEALESQYKKLIEEYNSAVKQSENIQDDIKRIKKILERTETPAQEHNGPGLRCSIKGFELLIGRNAKENDDLLRHYANPNDTWLHTRDFPGGYVFIKFKRNKTIPLDVLLDAANIAVLFSKGRDNTKVDLYYTLVRHLRRAKDSKTGLVLPSQEKNLTITPDIPRAQSLLNSSS